MISGYQRGGSRARHPKAVSSAAPKPIQLLHQLRNQSSSRHGSESSAAASQSASVRHSPLSLHIVNAFITATMLRQTWRLILVLSLDLSCQYGWFVCLFFLSFYSYRL
eukprot:TRINITY_DN9982_c0_g1_i2.p1 TRINITY_DN9982_c0_g1~~TRINITY_DN9982_c0_g1_i2.p1  ORF type:complete len:108 (+),score=15.56 TRINITY_DN9982_c0_g1_i2:74-397(+)